MLSSYYIFIFTINKFKELFMNYKKLFASFSLFILLFVCFAPLNVANAQSESQTKVIIETNFGNMKVVLYNDTPLHRDNFIKMVKDHYYDSLLFPRCIQNFMIHTRQHRFELRIFKS